MKKRHLQQIESVYLVRWPDGVTKVGYTSFRRWRTFEIRGAAVLAVWAFDDCTEGLRCETAMQAALRFPAAFPTSDSATEHLGHSGGGYMECYRIPEEVTDDQVLAMLTSIATEHGGQAMVRSMHGRTYERTDVEGTPEHGDITFSLAREKSAK